MPTKQHRPRPGLARLEIPDGYLTPGEGPRSDPGDLLAAAALIGLVLLFFWKMAFTDLILPRGDAFTYFYPYWAYRHAALRAGQIPLWNPYLFMGTPFLANSQAGVLYPPNWLLAGFTAPTAVKIAALLHLAWAGIGMVLFGRRSLRLSVYGAVLAGALFTLGGYLTAQVEHINQLQGLAWLPWLFWLWSEAMSGRRKMILWLGAAFGLQLLAGHTQSSFISGVGLGLWALWHTLMRWQAARKEPENSAAGWKTLAWPLGGIGLAVLLALGLAAAQLLPTLELAGLSNRSGGLTFLEAVSFSLKPQVIGRALLPSYADESLFSEYSAFIGVVGLVFALLGGAARRRDWPGLGLIGLAGLGLFFALGSYNPVYWALVRFVPGFDLFRAPARWLVLWAFGAAALAGLGVDWLTGQAGEENARRLGRLWPGAVVIVLAGLSFLAPLSRDPVIGAAPPALRELLIWAAWLIGGLGLIWWIPRSTPAAGRYTPVILIALALAELFLGSRNLPYNDLSTPAAWEEQRPAISTLLAGSQDELPPGRYLSISDTLFDPGDMRELQASFGPRLTESALFDYIVATKEKEILAPNLSMAWGIPAVDGFDGGILPTRDYTRFVSLFTEGGQAPPDGRLRENLSTVPELSWLVMSNTRWIITDKTHDAWVDGVYYDLQFTGAESRVVEAVPWKPFEATALGIIGHFADIGAHAPDAEIARVTLTSSDRAEVTFGLTAADFTGQALGAYLADRPDLAAYHAQVSWEAPLTVQSIEITMNPDYLNEPLIGGLSLIDERSGAFMPVTLSPGGAIRLAHSAEVKIYEVTDTLPRAYLACQPLLVSDQGAAWAALAESGGAVTVIEEPDPPTTFATCDPESPGTVEFVSYGPERIVLRVSSRGEGNYLVLSDAWYPGWQAAAHHLPEPSLFPTIRRANGIFRAVYLPPGDYDIEFVYQSKPFLRGVVISMESLLVLVTGLVLRWRPKERD